METVRGAAPRDVIALVWFRLGFRPRDSLVVVGLHGPARSSGVILRADLPRPGAPPGVPEILGDRIGGTLRRNGAGAAVALLVADDVLAAPPPPLVEPFRRALSERGVDLLDVLGVGATGYRSLLCPERDCCPAEGHPLAEVLSSRVAAASVLEGSTLAAAEQGIVADVDPPVPEGGPEPPIGHAAPPGGLGRAARAEWWRSWCAAFDAGELPEAEAAGLGAALRDGRLRDGVLVLALGAPRDLVTAAVLAPGEGRLDRLYAEGGAADLGRLLAVRPRGEAAARVERARTVLAAAARAAPPGRRADALAVLAWLAWYTGRGPRARLLAERALADVPGHPLAATLGRVLGSQFPPPWAEPPGPAAAATRTAEPGERTEPHDAG